MSEQSVAMRDLLRAARAREARDGAVAGAICAV